MDNLLLSMISAVWHQPPLTRHHGFFRMSWVTFFACNMANQQWVQYDLGKLWYFTNLNEALLGMIPYKLTMIPRARSQWGDICTQIWCVDSGWKNSSKCWMIWMCDTLWHMNTGDRLDGPHPSGADPCPSQETILGAQVSSHLGAYVGVARIKWKSYLAQMPKLPSFLENFQQILGCKKGEAIGGNGWIVGWMVGWLVGLLVAGLCFFLKGE